MTLPVVLAIGLIGGLGSLARFLLDAAVAARVGRAFPWGTLTINLSGSFVLGLLTGLALRGDARLIVATGLIGSFTTFSTWMLDSVLLRRSGMVRLAALNVAGSMLLGFGAVALGRAIGTAF